MNNCPIDEGDSASVELGLRNRTPRQQLFTPSPLITPNVNTYRRPYRGLVAMSHSQLIDFDHELNPTTSSHGSIVNHKIDGLTPKN